MTRKQETWHCRPDYGKENVYRLWDENDNYHDDTGPEAMDKRAQLITAAPKLLAALKAANIILLQQNKYSQADHEAMDVIQLAIAKAEEDTHECQTQADSREWSC